jgi:hypothetical protein
MIKIITGHSYVGGSTTVNINLCNIFNSKGYDCIMYGPHPWHTDKCRGKTFNEIKLNSDDIIIAHFMRNITTRLPVKKLILSTHEKKLFDLKVNPYKQYDKIHFSNDRQRLWHQIDDHPYFVCPNPHEILEKKSKDVEKIAGIIGTIDRNKNIHVSIEKALSDGMKEIKIFGTISDEQYFNESVKPLIEKNKEKIKLMGYIDDSQTVYDSISDVYMSSENETASLVVDECFMTGTTFHGNDVTPMIDKLMTNDEVFEIWKKELELD